MYYTILYYTRLDYTILHYTILHYTILCYNVICLRDAASLASRRASPGDGAEAGEARSRLLSMCIYIYIYNVYMYNNAYNV